MNRCRAFTLPEILVVLGIIGILAAVTLPGINSLLVSSKLNTAAGLITDQLALARQTAMTRGSRVEVRFYEIERNGQKTYGAFRTLIVSDTGTISPLGKLKELPSPIIISDTANHSPIFRAQAGFSGTEDLPGKGSCAYYRFSFFSNGRTDFDPGSNWFLTLLPDSAPTSTAASLPKNYAVLQIDDFTGHVRMYRP